MAREIVIYADESIERGPIFSNFYGGGAVESVHLAEVIERLDNVKRAHGLTRELKWQRVTEQYLDRYVAFIDETFELLRERKLRLRVMFTQNRHLPAGLTRYHYDNQFQILYYHFIKHAFGFQWAADPQDGLRLRLFFDRLPGTKEQVVAFKAHVRRLEKDRAFQRANVKVPGDQIAEIDSADHVVLQAVDIVLGAMQFRLNKQHLVKPVGARVRGKRTRAKEALYKRMNQHIRQLRPGFNIGISTGHADGDRTVRWNDPYRHSLFMPRDRVEG